ncbi:MAG: sugar ABC transporter ATP-binding protein [Synergistaceae bacterium]|jgi:simple sugar transport system ATP-binding protein|nr:sugar ABC transporter ATP-binding protein [Synergistaceae bacterium]
MEDFITVENISKNFSGLKALRDISFSIKKGEALGLCGANGSGKSTLIKILAGVLSADSGKIKIEGAEMVSYGPLGGIMRGISVIYQDISLFPTLTVLENICVARAIGQGRILSILGSERARAEAILGDLGVSINIDSIVEELPIASQQLVAIARALNNDSKLIILDEPTTALTSKEVGLLFKIVNKLKNSGISVIFISHKIDEIVELCDRVLILRDGGLIAAKPIKDTNLEEIETLMVGQSLVYSKMDDVDREAPVVLEVNSLTKKNNFKDIGFSLRHGEVLGVIGLLGSGRTELALALFGINAADSGKIAVDGTECRVRTVNDAVSAGIAYVPEDRLTEGLVMNYPIRENIVLATLDKFKDKFTFLKRRSMSEAAQKWLRTLSIKTDSPDNIVSSLSGGNQQKVVLAKWLERNPKILILDSPTVGIDIAAKAGIFAILKTMIAENGMGIILISDEIKEITAYSHRAIIMRNGRVAKILPKDEINEERIRAILNEQKQTK